MADASSSPFARPDAALPIREGAPPLARPTKEEVERFPAEAASLLGRNWAAQAALIAGHAFDLEWLAGRHVLIAGATGPGLGGALASAILGTRTAASLTIIARDLSRSIGYETGRAMQSRADADGWGTRFHWLNDGMALEGPAFDGLLAALAEARANRVVYFNCVAGALSGLLPGTPPVFVKDRDATGLFQWQLAQLDERAIETTRFLMGEMAVRFPGALRDAGIAVDAEVYADWRGSLDRASRDPSQPTFGRHGAYSTSLYLPKDVIQEATRAAYGTGRVVLDIFYPMMRTRALPFIPGGMLTADVNEAQMEREGIRRPDTPELAIAALERVGRALRDPLDNPFPRLDSHDAHLDEWLFEVMSRLSGDPASEFFYERWLPGATS